MAAEKQTRKHGGSRFGRLRGRLNDAATTATNRSHAFGPFVRISQPANDNRVPVSLLILRTVVAIAVLGAIIAAVL